MFRSPSLFTTITILLFASVQQTWAYEFTFYSEKGCQGAQAPTPVWVGGPNEGCRRENGGAAQSVFVKSTGDVDNNFMAVFFGSDDCNPDNEIGHLDSGCIDKDGGYASFQVWDLS